MRSEMAARNRRSSTAAPEPLAGEDTEDGAGGGRYRPLPTGTHGLDPDAVKRDQRERLQQAIVELIAAKGYQAVRIADLAKLARVSQPTFYELFADKEALFVSAYDEIAGRTGSVVLSAYSRPARHGERLRAGMLAFTELANAEPEAMSLLVLGAFGAGPSALEHRSRSIEELELRIRARRSPGRRSTGPAGAAQPTRQSDLTVMSILGGVREVTAIRLVRGRQGALPGLVDEIAAWAACYPENLPEKLLLPAPRAARGKLSAARRDRRGERLPSGRSEMPRPLILKSQKERIVNATAEIVAKKGLAGLTIPEITRRANVSNQTFYEIYPSKHDAFLGAQRIGMEQAFRRGVEAWEAAMPDWPAAIAAGLRGVVGFIVAEPDLAHLTIVDTFGASPETIAARDTVLRGFATYFDPGYELAPPGVTVPAVAAEAVVGGCWQLLHHFVESNRIEELPAAAPQLTFLLLTPFLGPERAAAAAGEELRMPASPSAVG